MRNTHCTPSDIQGTISYFLCRYIYDCSKLVPTPPLTLRKITFISFFSVAKIFGVGFLWGGGKGGSLGKKYRICA